MHVCLAVVTSCLVWVCLGSLGMRCLPGLGSEQKHKCHAHVTGGELGVSRGLNVG